MEKNFNLSMKTVKISSMPADDQIEEAKKRNLLYSEVIDKELLKLNMQGQSPAYFVLSCVDSRVVPSDILGMAPGDVLCHRNIANTCFEDDITINSAITFATEVLKIKHLIVMGHQDCGGLLFSIKGNDKPYIGEYLKRVREAYEKNPEEIDSIECKSRKSQRLAEINALIQAYRVLKHPVVQESRKETGYPKIHAWVYTMENGLIKDLKFEDELDS